MTSTIIRVSDDLYLDCPVLAKDRVLVMPRGLCATLEFQIRDRDGKVVDICEFVADSDPDVSTTTTPAPGEGGQVIFRFKDAFNASPEIVQAIGWAHNCEEGLVRVELPSTLSDYSNVFQFNVGITDGQGRVRVIDQGLLSVERSLFVDVSTPGSMLGPLTVGEIRTHLRDTITENSLLDDFEFSDAEIISCIAKPIMEWNETPPAIDMHTAHTFPYRYHWLNATASHLLRTAAYWYLRNKLQASHGGIQVDDRNKDQAYLQLAELLSEQWKDFIRRKKIELNIQSASGSVHSTYGYGWY